MKVGPAIGIFGLFCFLSRKLSKKPLYNSVQAKIQVIKSKTGGKKNNKSGVSLFFYAN
jgi:hypothetical protein